ncbi:MAG: hypothetical protein K2P38_13910 [Lachnospiraceae bacterium]|nr:hypothetical protein [Lachnospiraceae bacterium]
MTNPTLYRRRIIPDECVMLKDDIILYCSRERIVTSWNTLHPKKRPAPRHVLLFSSGRF